MATTPHLLAQTLFSASQRTGKIKRAKWKRWADRLHLGGLLIVALPPEAPWRSLMNAESAGLVVHPTQIAQATGEIQQIAIVQVPVSTGGPQLDALVATGAGAYNLAGAAIPSAAPYTINRHTNGLHLWGGAVGEPFESVSREARQASNFMLVHGRECRAAQRVVEFNGNRGGERVDRTEHNGRNRKTWGKWAAGQRYEFPDEGLLLEHDCAPNCPARQFTADNRKDRLYFNAFWDWEQSEPKASASRGGLPISLWAYQGKLFLPPASYAPRRADIGDDPDGALWVGLRVAGWEVIRGGAKNNRAAYWATRRFEAPANAVFRPRKTGPEIDPQLTLADALQN